MDNARSNYIDLLSDYAKHFTPARGAPDEKRESVLSGELIEAELLTGAVLRDADDEIRGASVNGITVKGRLFLDQLQREQREASVSAKLKKWGVPLLTYLAGVTTPILSDLLKAICHVRP
jgi:hypothetical protein